MVTVTKLVAKKAIDEVQAEEKRVTYVASEILLYTWIFYPDCHSEIVSSRDSCLKEEAIMVLCKILSQKGDEFYELLCSLQEEAEGEECILGLESQTVLTKKQFAAQIANDVKGLLEPLDIRVTLPF